MRIEHDEHHKVTVAASIREWRALISSMTGQPLTYEGRQLARSARKRIELAVDPGSDGPPWEDHQPQG